MENPLAGKKVKVLTSKQGTKAMRFEEGSGYAEDAEAKAKNQCKGAKAKTPSERSWESKGCEKSHKPAKNRKAKTPPAVPERNAEHARSQSQKASMPTRGRKAKKPRSLKAKKPRAQKKKEIKTKTQKRKHPNESTPPIPIDVYSPGWMLTVGIKY